MTLPCHTNPRQTCPVAEGKKNEQLQASPKGWIWSVSATPAITPWVFFTGHRTALLAPPRVPRSVEVPSSHRVARVAWSPDRLEDPAIHPRSLMLLPALTVPPSEASSMIRYWVAPARPVRAAVA